MAAAKNLKQAEKVNVFAVFTGQPVVIGADLVELLEKPVMAKDRNLRQ